MLPHHIITSVVFLSLDLTPLLARSLHGTIGVATFTGKVEGGLVDFDLHVFVLRPADRPESLFDWLDTQLADSRATLTGYNLAATLPVVRRLPGGRWSTAMRALAARRRQPVIDIISCKADGTPLSFKAACGKAGIPGSRASQGDFAAWLTGRTAPLACRAEADAIAAWRLTMRRIAEQTSLGERVAASIDLHLAAWLREADRPSAQAHLDSVLRTAG